MIREVPQPPKLKGQTHYTFQELLEFEMGNKELRLNQTRVTGPKPRPGMSGPGAPPKVKYDLKKMRHDKFGNVEHETISEPFKPAYTMTSERSQSYLSRMHGRCAQNFGQ